MKIGQISPATIWMVALAVVVALMPSQAVHAQGEASIKVSKAAIVFDKENAKKGEVITIDNTSGSDLTLGIELPNKGFSYAGVVRKPDQMRVRPEDWARFTLSAGSGVFIVIIPSMEPTELEALDGKQIVVKVYQGNKVREDLRIPIKVALNLKFVAAKSWTDADLGPMQDDHPITLNKKSILFGDQNVKTGEMIVITNKSGSDQTIGIELPRQGLSSSAMVHKPEESRVPRETWPRYILPPNSGVAVKIIPHSDPAIRQMLDGKEVCIKVYEGNEVREILWVPIELAPNLKVGAAAPSSSVEPTRSQTEELVRVDKTSILFDEKNVRKGDVINIDNKSGSDLTLGLELPNKGLWYSGVIRKPEQTKLHREKWERFTLPPNSGVFIVLIPDDHRPQLETLDGTEIRIRIHEGNELREVRRIPIKVHADLLRGTKE
ncbi:MAG: hypothetical protein AB1473_23235 [Thermodesulfobacteriota bacterium]